MFVKLNIGKTFTFVDLTDYEYLKQWNWCFDGRYAYRREFKSGKVTKFYMHKQLLSTPKGFDTDHINGDKLDNRRCNLRIATRGQNNANTPKQKGCSSRYRGVCWHSQRNKWKAEIKVNQTKKHLGVFINEEDAARAYDAAAKQAFGDYATLNFTGEMK